MAAAGTGGDATAGAADHSHSRQSLLTVESREWGRAEYAGATRRRDSQRDRAVDTLGPLLALPVTLAQEQDRTQAETLATHGQAATEETGQIACGDQG